jgi:hypothetical protein
MFAARHLVIPALILGAVHLCAPTATADVPRGENATVATQCTPEPPRVDPLVVTVASCGALGAASAVVYLVATLREEDQE